MSQGSLSAAAQALNRVKSFYAGIRAALELVLAVSLATVAVSLWSIVRPQQELEQLALGGIVLVLAVAATIRSRARRHRITLADLTLSLEMKHGSKTRSPLGLDRADEPLSEEWKDLVRDEIKALRRYESVRMWALASSLVVPIAISFVTLPSAAPSFKLAFSEVTNVVSRLTRGATMRVVVGATGEGHEQKMTLSATKPVRVELLAQNLVEIELTGGGFGKGAPVVALRKPATDQAAVQDFQSFQMTPVREGPDGTEAATRYSISFAVSEPVDLFIPALDAAPLAHIQVRQLPIPKVKLTAISELEDPWPDDQPLALRITVRAENPLEAVRLLIKSGQRVSKELVANVVAEDKTELTTEYRLVLETYVESDLAQVEIQAEAVDRAVPQPLVGHSDVLKLNTASAYGRYRATLQTLRDLKSLVDEAVSKQDPKLPKEARELATKAGDQSERSPFFDGLDRVQIHRFETRVAEVNTEQGAEKISELSQSLNDFLFEHEILDDRERDRDFFVAARGLSRLIEQDASKRPVVLKTVADRMRKFLSDRQERWAKRVERLSPPFKPEKWPELRDKKPFHEAITQVEKLDDKAKTSTKAKADELTVLSKAVVDYRAWIEELESKEDKMREDEEKQRQEGLASARDQLKELQKRQGEISAELDRSQERSKDDLEGQWPATRMKENTNAKETRRLESQMRSLSPTASGRIQAAVEAMEQTLDNGNTGNFTLAETNSDLAGRLLRQAESAAQQSQQKRKNRGRRRRVTGDNYYGQSIVGGDIEIKREYQVDRRYREDILDEVQESTYDDENRALLENYLREVVR